MLWRSRGLWCGRSPKPCMFAVGASEAETFWTEFLRGLARLSVWRNEGRARRTAGRGPPNLMANYEKRVARVAAAMLRQRLKREAAAKRVAASQAELKAAVQRISPPALLGCKRTP
jgi:hypothetical protein